MRRMTYTSFRPLMLLILTAAISAGAVQSTVTLTTSANPSILGHAVTLTATITPATALGPVTFFDGSTILGINQVFSGKASITTTLLPSGVRSLRAYFAGDNNTVPNTSATVKQTVNSLGSNGFLSAVNYPDTTGATFVAVGDFNGDGRPDLAVINPSQETKKLMIMLGVGDGTFKPAALYDVGPGPVAVAIADLNGDGQQDLALLDGMNSNVTLMYGLRDGTFTAGGSYATALSPTALAIADFNGDGLPDIAVATPSGITVLIGVLGGVFQPGVFYAGGLASSVAVGDFNGDGITDIAIGSPNGVGVMLGLGNGAFLPRVDYPTGVGGGPILVADFNGDGLADIATTAGSSVSIALSKGDGTFKNSIQSISGASNAFVQTLAVGDFDGDGKLDLATANFSGTPSGTNISILLGIGNGSFQAPVPTPLSGVNFAVAADLNGDGVLDLVTASLGPIGVLIANPAPVITPPPPPPPTPPSVAAGGVLNAASFAKDGSGKGTAVAPGSLVSIFGTFPGAVQADAATVPFGDSLGGVTITFNNIAAPVRDVIPAANEINAQMPFGIQGTGSANTVNVVVTIAGLASAPVAVPIVPSAPGIFTIPPTGLGNAVLVFADPADNIGKIAAPVSAAATIGLPVAPVPRGTPAYFYATGLGAMSPSVADGAGGLEPPGGNSFRDESYRDRGRYYCDHCFCRAGSRIPWCESGQHYDSE